MKFSLITGSGCRLEPLVMQVFSRYFSATKVLYRATPYNKASLEKVKNTLRHLFSSCFLDVHLSVAKLHNVSAYTLKEVMDILFQVSLQLVFVLWPC